MTDLPKSASKKLRDLERAHADAGALARAGVGALANLRVSLANAQNRRGVQPNDVSLAEACKDLEQQIAVAEREIELRGRREASVGQTVTKVREWLQRLPSNRTLEPVEPPPFGDASLEYVRGQIVDLQREQRGIQQAPLPVADQKRAIRDYVAHMAEAGAPRINRIGTLTVDFGHGGSKSAEVLLAWLDPEAFAAALERDLGASWSPAGALSAEQRKTSERELTDRILELERVEEAMITIAHAAGQDVLRRPQADPRAILGVAVVKAIKAAKAA